MLPQLRTSSSFVAARRSERANFSVAQNGNRLSMYGRGYVRSLAVCHAFFRRKPLRSPCARWYHARLQAVHERATRDVSLGVQKKTETGTPVAAGASEANGSAAELVTEVLGRVEGTNRGIACTPEQREEIDGLIEQVCLPSSYCGCDTVY